ncbi:PhnE/PtxC family ABC transporter permease [Synechocystis sp. PCC 7509]|uniref:PhnE/PtxC family ABC transporter permease n=1 Tax=Synechocystis sp. PCC 7509 TaxID=927677 RepID=UPI0002ABEDAD|nr:ABC transporter permease subunit [Synechocystis sp. PCC 7509]
MGYINKQTKPQGRRVFTLCLLAVIWALHTAGVFSGDVVNAGGGDLVRQFLVAAIHPNLSWEFLLLTWEATLKTFAYAVCGTFLSLAIATIGGIFCSQVWWESVLGVSGLPWLGIRAGLAIPIAIHELIWGLFFINIFGLDPLVAVLAIAIPFGAITAKVFSEILDETPRQAFLALLNSGISPLNAFIYSLIPQAQTNLISYAFYRFECSIRAAAVLGIIGAGGLGYQILLSLQSLRYEEMWTLLIALVLLSGVTDFASALVRCKIGAPSRLDLMSKPTASKSVPWWATLGIVMAIACSFWYVDADFSKLWIPRTGELLIDVVKQAFPPDYSQLREILRLCGQTLAMSILAIAFAGCGGIFLSFFAANNLRLPGGIVTLVSARFFLLFTRAIPAPIWALIFLFVLFPGILPGAIALGIHNMGILGRLMAEVTENLDDRPLKSLKALGASNSQIFLYGVLPQTMPKFIAYILYRWEVCIRATVIVGLVGAGGLGRLLTEQLSSFDYPGVVATLVCFIGLTFFVDIISATIRQML